MCADLFSGKKEDARASSKSVSALPFNARGVVENPDITLEHLPTSKCGIGVIARAHRTPKGWIAETENWTTFGNLLGDGQLPNDRSVPFPSRSVALDDALSRDIRTLGEKLGARSGESAAAKHLHGFEEWVADTLATVRADDTDLPMHGRTFMELCAGGMGGGGIALVQAGATCKLAVEIDPDALALYCRHVRPQATHADFRTLDGRNLKTDLLFAGAPCPGHSVAGQHLGMEHAVWGEVNRHILRLVGEIDAQVVVIECARQLLTHGDGQDAALVRKTLMRAGFRVQHRTLDAARFGVPQHRERSFIVGTRIGVAADRLLGYCFPEGDEPSATVADILEPGVNGVLSAHRIKARRAGPAAARSGRLEQVGLIDGKNRQGYRVYDPRGIGAALCASSGGACPQTGAYLVGGKVRGLTPREAYRLQGMPEWAQPDHRKTHALRHAGNGVAVPVVRELARAIGAQIFHTNSLQQRERFIDPPTRAHSDADCRLAAKN